VSEGGLRERRHAALRRFDVDLNLPSFAHDDDSVLSQFLRRAPRQIERVDRLKIRLVPAAFDPGGDAELVEQLGQLPRCLVDHLEVALLRLAEVTHADEGLRKSVDGRQRGP
jgi:hypothetical protein